MWQVCSRIGWYWSGLSRIYIYMHLFLLSIFPMSSKKPWISGQLVVPFCATMCPATHPPTNSPSLSLYHSWESQPSMLTVWVVHLLFNKSAISPSNQKWPPETCSQKQPVYNTPEDMAFFVLVNPWTLRDMHRHATLTDLPMFFYETSKSLYKFSNGLVTISWCIDRVLSAKSATHEQDANQITTSPVSLPAYVLLWRSILLGLCCQQTSWTMQREWNKQRHRWEWYM